MKIETTYVPAGCVHRNAKMQGHGWFAETDTEVFGPFKTEREAVQAAVNLNSEE
jgi:hypothetical protein